MPIYEFVCEECRSRTEELYITSVDAPRQITCACGGGTATRVPSAFTVDFNGPKYKALERNDRVVVEPGLDRDIERNKKYQAEKLDRQLEKAVEKAAVEHGDLGSISS